MSEKIYYNLGKLQEGKIIWNKVDNLGETINTEYDKGYKPKCSINDNSDIIEVHCSGKHNFYNIGKIKDNSVEWSKKGTKYDEGRNPSVSLNNNNRVVEIHQRNSSTYFWPPSKAGYEKIKSFNQYFRFGNFNGKSIEWRDKEKGTEFTSASGADVCINNCENFDIGIAKGDFYYKGRNEYASIGGISNFFSGSKNGVPLLNQQDTRLYYPSSNTDESSRNPSIALNDNNDFIIVYNTKKKLYYRIGTLNSKQMKIVWKSASKEYDKGSLASIALNNSGDIIEVHRGESTNNLYYMTGKLIESSIKWNQKKGVFFSKGTTPSVDINNKNEIIIVHT